MFAIISCMWLFTIFLLLVPNNQLRQMGLGNAIAIDLTVGVLVALAIAIASLRMRKTCPGKLLFFATQVLAWGHSVGVLATILIAAIIAMQRGL